MSENKPGDGWTLQAQIRTLERQIAVLRRLVEKDLGPCASEAWDRLAYDSHFQPEILYHITPAEYYHHLAATEAYLPQGYTHDGFIHCTRGADLLVLVANRHFRSMPGEFLMLVIDAGLLTAPLKYESLDSALPHPFPHIYGPLNRDAIVEVIRMIRDADGTFLSPPYTEA